MSVAELKEKIISIVSHTENEAVLEKCLDMITPESDWVLELDEEDIKELDRRDAEIDKGEFYTNEEAMSLLLNRSTQKA